MFTNETNFTTKFPQYNQGNDRLFCLMRPRRGLEKYNHPKNNKLKNILILYWMVCVCHEVLKSPWKWAKTASIRGFWGR
jgi:hypothetical protein